MKPKILLQKNVFSEDETKDTEEIIKNYFEVKILKDEDVALREVPKNYEGTFRGSLMLAQRLGRKFLWADATKWAPYFKKEIVSQNYLFLDAESIKERNDFPLFIRPTTGNKTFSGNVYTKEKFIEEINFLIQNKNGNPYELCLIAQPVKLEKEYRTIFINNKYSASSQYMDKGKISQEGEAPQKIIDYAIKLSKKPYFQNVFDYTIDVAITKDGPKLIEINALETASFYKANLNKIYSDWAKSLIEIEPSMDNI